MIGTIAPHRRIARIILALFCTALLAGCFAPPLPAEAASKPQGTIRHFARLDDADTDTVGTGRTIGGDGQKDLGFTLNLTGAGAVTRIVLKDATHNRTWDTSSGGNPVLVVQGDDGRIFNTTSGIGIVPFILGTNLTPWVNDRTATMAEDATFEVTVHFSDKSTDQAKITVKALPQPKPTAEIVSAAFLGERDIKVTGPQRIGGLPFDPSPYKLVTEVRVKGEGEITGFRLHLAKEGTDVWSTMLDGDSRLLVVLSADATQMLNKADGRVAIPLKGEAVFRLVADSDETLAAGKTRTIVTVQMDGDRVLEKDAALPKTEEKGKLALDFLGRGNYDFTGPDAKPAANLTRDYNIRAKLPKAAKLTGIKIVGSWEADKKTVRQTWDTVPATANHAVVVTREDGKPLNRMDGAISEQVEEGDTLFLWFDAEQDLTKGSKFTVTFLFSDGSILEERVESPAKAK